jgi:hypothetical protein
MNINQVDSTDANSNAGLQEAMGEQNLHTLQNQVADPLPFVLVNPN